MSETLVKRKRVYVMTPASYEISGCKCGNADPEWSEYEGRLWCPTCEIDFVPESGGIFDGPIPVNGMELMGVSLDQRDLLTGEIVTLASLSRERAAFLRGARAAKAQIAEAVAYAGLLDALPVVRGVPDPEYTEEGQ